MDHKEVEKRVISVQPVDHDVPAISDAQLRVETEKVDEEVEEWSDDIQLSARKLKTPYQQADEAGSLPGADKSKRYSARSDIPVEENGQTVVPNHSQGSEDCQRNVVTANGPVSLVDNDVHAISDAQREQTEKMDGQELVKPDDISLSAAKSKTAYQSAAEAATLPIKVPPVDSDVHAISDAQREQLRSDEHKYNLRRLPSAWLLMSLNILVYIVFSSGEVQTESLIFLHSLMTNLPLKKHTMLKYDLRDVPKTITEEEIAKKMKILDEPLDQLLSQFSQWPFTSSTEFDKHAKLCIYISTDASGNEKGKGGIGAYFADEISNPKCVRYFYFCFKIYKNKSKGIAKLNNHYLEVLAILVAFKAWDKYFQNKEVFVRTDSSFACTLIRNIRKDKERCLEWKFFLGQFAAMSKNVIIQPTHIKRQENIPADMLSKGKIKGFKAKICEEGIKREFVAFDKEIINRFLLELDSELELAHKKFQGSGN